MTHFILIRHGETEWNREVRFRGRADISLNDVGLAQAAATGRRIAAAWQPAAIYCSPMIRARQTAAAIAEWVSLPVQPHEGLYDIDFGQLQGLTVDEAAARWPEVVRSWVETPGATRFPGGERLADLHARAMAMLETLTVRHENETVVLVGHTVINRVILRVALVERRVSPARSGSIASAHPIHSSPAGGRRQTSAAFETVLE
ncbi:MAG: histidine phosphatase family protein [Chloroflexi bacterium HGW-Chloroflexi-1]|nr:MAG: histidine phosphatase family protein [Chloroflexi bacterium HGW-Chloroflexi-1]